VSSPPAKASLVIALLMPALLIVSFVAYFLFKGEARSGMGAAFGVTLLLSPIAHIVGLILGVVALAARPASRTVALAGTILNGFFILGALGLALIAIQAAALITH
jgi:hypothetical protein